MVLQLPRLNPTPTLQPWRSSAGCMLMISLATTMALSWHFMEKVVNFKPSRHVGWADVTGKEENGRDGKRSLPLLLLASRTKLICLISGSMTAFEALRFFSAHEEPITLTDWHFWSWPPAWTSGSTIINEPSNITATSSETILKAQAVKTSGHEEICPFTGSNYRTGIN